MPHFYAHLVFGDLVRRALPEELRGSLQRASFSFGLMGPDPLFFYYLPLHHTFEVEGHTMHRGSPAPALERLRQAGGPDCWAYAAGFLCHYFLDAACHPYIYGNARKAGLGHMRMEREFDYFLSSRHTTPHLQAYTRDRAVHRAAAPAYEHGTPFRFQAGLWNFGLFCRTVSRWTRRHRPRDPRAVRLIKASNAALYRSLRNAVAPAAEAVLTLRRRFDTGQPVDFLPAVDFAGRAL